MRQKLSQPLRKVVVYLDPREFHSTWLDNSKAKHLLGWRPRYDLKRLIDEAYDYKRAPDNPRKIWYPG